MKPKKSVSRWFLFGLFFFGIGGAVSAQTYFDVAPLNGNYTINYTQVPDVLVSINPNIIPLLQYQWEQSSSPLNGFVAVTPTSTPVAADGSQVNLTLTQPLTQTTYFRRKLTWLGDPNFSWQFPPYSNTVRIQVVSLNWENLNYIREHDVQTPGLSDWKAIDQLSIGQKLQTTTYLDGLGRSIEKVSREMATPDPSHPTVWGDLVQFAAYDLFGKVPVHYLPYTTTTEPGKFKSAPLTEQPQYYANTLNETSAFTTETYDNSPLNRVTNIKAPGASWAASQGNAISYDMNDATDNVQIFSIGYNTGDAPVDLGVYPINTLFKITHADEKGRQVVEYKNKTGQTILEKVQLDDHPSAAHSGWICTYSIFDDFGLLRCRLQPEAVKWLDANGWSFAGVNGQQVLNELTFRYEYDEKGRVILKKVPGAKEIYTLYDPRDRAVFIQDGNQRAKSPGEWMVNFYDALDRTVMTGLYVTAKARTDLQTDVNNTITVTPAVANLVINSRDASISTYIARNSIEFDAGFSSAPNDAFTTLIDPNLTNSVYASPIGAVDVNDPSKFTALRYNYYDDYSYTGAKPFDNGFTNGSAYAADPTIDLISGTVRTISKLTGSRVRVLGTTTFLLSSLYYDAEGRMIQELEENIKSGTDITTTQYHFDGRLLSNDTRHTASGTVYNGYDILTKNIFDRVGRIISMQKKYGANDLKTIASYDYDDMGRLKTKHLDPGYTGSGKSELESLGYSYNIHNEITGINKDYALKTPGKYDKWGSFFGLYLGYDNKDGVFASQILNDQITGTLWTTQGDDAQRKYDFTYDNAGRLVNALYNEKQNTGDSWGNAKMNFSVTGSDGKIEYDLNGNLLSMLQKGVAPGNASPLNVDDLQYSYANLSNKLMKVTDNSNLGAANGKLGDFVDGSNGNNDDYVYDDNGNLVVDLNKNATALGGVAGANGIRYNFLDKPEEIHIAGKGTIRLVYDAAGNKLQKLFTPEGSTVTTTTTYIDEFVYQEDILQYINFEEGRVRVVQPVSQNNGYDLLAIDGNFDLPGGRRGAYDFFVRDYQGNVRMILTEEAHTGSNSCTMETARAANEEPLFGQVDANGVPTADNEVKARFPVASIPGQSSGAGWQNGTIGSYVSRLGNLAGKKVGPNTLLKVMAGDLISATAIYYYQDPVVNQTGGTSLLTDLLLSLGQAISGGGATAGLLHGSVPATNVTSQLGSSLPFVSAADPDAGNATGNSPKAYLSVLFFDERFNFIGEGSTVQRVSQSGDGASPLVLSNIKAPKNGYAYVYVSNESDEMVYFDNLQVGNNHGRIIEENHYYAYGLKIAGISSRVLPDVNEGHIGNKNLYNDKELIDEADLNWYDYGFRSYDPQIGRFTQLDPLTDDYPDLTPYQFAGCEPIANVDVDGLEPANVVAVANTIGESTVMELSRGRWAVSWVANGVAYAKIISPVATSALSSTVSVAVHLGLIETRGLFDALANANTIGLYDLLRKDPMQEFSEPDEQQAYYNGRVKGDGIAIVESAGEIKAGGGTAAVTGVETLGWGALAGGAMALHGAAAGGVATADLEKTLWKIHKLNKLAEGAVYVGKGGKLPNDLGKAGENGARSKSGYRIRYRGASGKERISDPSLDGELVEDKNVVYQYWSTQLKDAAIQAKNTGRVFILVVRKSTKLSKMLVKQKELGNVKIEYFEDGK